MLGNGRNEQGLMAGSFLGGVLVGGLIGTGITLLTTPRSGEQTRRQIQEEVAKAQMGVEQTLAEVGQTLSAVGETLTGVHSRTLEVTGEAAAQAAELQTFGSAAVTEGQEQIESSVEEVKWAARRHRPIHNSVERARRAAHRLTRARWRGL